MPDVAMWAIVMLSGVALGIVFFGGLWFTVRRGSASPSPALWFLASFVLRTAIVLAGFYFIGGGQLVRLGMCLMGFLLARTLVLLATRPGSATVAQQPSKRPPCV